MLEHEPLSTRRFARLAVAFLYVLGWGSMVATLVGFALTLLPRRALHDGSNDSFRYPLSRLCGVGWDEASDRVLIALCPYGRIQAYEVDGTFAYGFNVAASGGDFRMTEAGPGEFRLIIERGDREFRVNATGRRLASEPGSARRPSAPGHAERPQISVKSGFLLDSVLIERGDAISTLSPTALGWVLQVPFPAGLLGICGILMLRAASRLRGRTPSSGV